MDSNTSTLAPQPAEEERQQTACDAMWERKRMREQAAQDAQQKDPAWAYTMEQKLREYTTRKFQPTAIQVMEIDCRTTFCELMAEGMTPDPDGEFNKVISAITEEPWNDFTGISTSANDESGKLLYTAQINRKPSRTKTPEQRAEDQMESRCVALMAQRQNEERAARFAEPRDASWADPMEQLIRQHLTTQLARHPVATLEVECRTTFCRIRATGRVKASYLAFQKISQEIGKEAWSDLRGGAEGGGGSSGETWHQEYSLYRD